MAVEKTIDQIKANKTMTESQTNDRALATVRTIDALEPIEGADNIEMARVGGWKVVVGKGLYSVGDKVVYFEIDSLLPLETEFSFLKESNIKTLPDGTQGYRLKTIKLKGQISQGLVLPINDAINIIKRNVKKGCRQSIDNDEIGDNDTDKEVIKEFSDDLIDDLVNIGNMPIGHDLTHDLGVRKYEVATTSGGGSGKKSSFPHFIPKTDEERIQNLSKEIPEWLYKEIPFYITEKLDGCLDKHTLIETEDGKKTIREICKNRYTGKVKSYDVNNGEIVWRNILSHSVKEPDGHQWFELTLEDDTIIKITGNHEVWLPNLNCWRRVDQLNGDEEFLLKN